jgi:glycosyltransferase involved in cell wall biosynthesis
MAGLPERARIGRPRAALGALVSERPLVSIVTPSYNQAAYLEEAIESVLAQDYAPIEYAVVDGGSTDGSVEIIRRYEDRLAWWKSEPDGGQAAALNEAFARTEGAYLGWLNSDDTLLPGSVSTVVAALESDPGALFAYGDAIHTDEQSRRTSYFVSADLEPVEMVRTVTDHINPQGALFRRDALLAAGPLEGFYCWDFELVLRLGARGHAVRIDRPVATFRLHDESKSVGSSFARRAEDYVAMYDRFFATPDLPPALRAVEQEAKAAVRFWAGQYFLQDGDRARARRSYLDGMRLHRPAIGVRRAAFLARTLLPRR